jgi:hypothetical protein
MKSWKLPVELKVNNNSGEMLELAPIREYRLPALSDVTEYWLCDKGSESSEKDILGLQGHGKK